MASPKLKSIVCPVQIGCDGNEILPPAQMCSKCKKVMEKRKRAGTTDARYWQVRPT